MKKAALGLAIAIGWSGAREPIVAQESAWETDTFATTGEIVPGTGRIGGIAVDVWGYVYVANFDLGVWRIAPGGETELLADGLYGSSGIVVLPNGDLLQGNWLADEIVRIDRHGEVHPFADEMMNGPVGIAIAPTGHVYTTNSRGNTVTRFDSDGSNATEFLRHELLQEPNSIVSDRQGNLYIANLSNPSILKVTPEADVTEIAKLPGQGNAHLALGPDGALYVTKIWDHVVMRVQMDGEYSVVSGNGLEGFQDGPAGTSTIAYPNGIAAWRGTLFFNTLDGDMRGGEDGKIVVRRLHFPTLRRMLENALEQDGVEGMLVVFRKFATRPGADVASGASQVYSVIRSFVRAGQIEAAEALAAEMIELDPNRSRALMNAGNVQSLAGTRQQAIEYYTLALDEDPSNEEAKRRLEGAQLFRTR